MPLSVGYLPARLAVDGPPLLRRLCDLVQGPCLREHTLLESSCFRVHQRFVTSTTCTCSRQVAASRRFPVTNVPIRLACHLTYLVLAATCHLAWVTSSTKPPRSRFSQGQASQYSPCLVVPHWRFLAFILDVTVSLHTLRVIHDGCVSCIKYHLHSNVNACCVSFFFGVLLWFCFLGGVEFADCRARRCFHAPGVRTHWYL